MLLLIVILAVAMSFSFGCSLMEACLLSISSTDIARIAEHKPLLRRIWQRFKKDIHKPLATILIINTFANTIGAAFAGARFADLFGTHWLPVFSIAFSLVFIQWCEILPKTLGVRYNRRLANITAPIFSIVVGIFSPLIRLTELLNRPFSGGKGQRTESAVSDIRVLARSAMNDNLLSREQEGLISRSVLMSSLCARDVMIDRNDINFLSNEMSLQDGLLASHVHRHTRFPLADGGNIDRIVGYVNFKDIVGALHTNPTDPSLRGITRPVVFVKESAGMSELLAKLTSGYQHIAIVQDFQGRTMGLVTLEDIIETLVGDLRDEYDTPPDFIVQLAEHRFRVGGHTTLRQIKARALPDIPLDENITVDEWIKNQTGGREPIEGFAHQLGPISLRVRRVVRGNIYDVIVERTTPGKAATP
jgi:putative hemolysin